MFKNSKARREILDGWKWIRATDDKDAIDTAEQWAIEHKEEMKQLDRILYDSENKYYNKFGFNDLEDEFGNSCATVDFIETIPQDKLDRINNDKDWFDMSKYAPRNSEKADSMLYLNAEFIEGLRELTEQQREVLFRNVIYRESIESIAASKNCSPRNIRAIRVRALNYLRKKAGTDKSGSSTISSIWLTIILLSIISLIYHFLLQPIFDSLPNWSIYLLASAFLIIACISYWKSQMQDIKEILRNWWQSHKDEFKDK